MDGANDLARPGLHLPDVGVPAAHHARQPPHLRQAPVYRARQPVRHPLQQHVRRVGDQRPRRCPQRGGRALPK